MIEAYATGFPIRISTYGTSTSAAGDGNPVGFTQPWANANGSANSGASSGANPVVTTVPPAGGVPTPGVTAPTGK
jgi:hypothetical protein